LGYVAIGIWLILKARQAEKTSLNVIGWSCLITGICAFIYHAGGTLLFQTLDLAGMYLFSSTLIILNLRRLGWFENKVILKSIFVTTFLFTLLFLAICGKSGNFIFGGQLFVALALEISLACRKSRPATQFQYYWLTLLLFGIGFTGWWLDHSGIICDPDQHFIQGHSIWHLSSAICFSTLFYFYRQFDSFGVNQNL
jgi:hypothetical protein